MILACKLPRKPSAVVGWVCRGIVEAVFRDQTGRYATECLLLFWRLFVFSIESTFGSGSDVDSSGIASNTIRPTTYQNPKVVTCHKAFESRIVYGGHFMQRLRRNID